MKAKQILSVLGLLCCFNAAYGRTATMQPRSVAISIDGFPLSLDVLKSAAPSSAKYHAEGTARVEGSAIIIDLAPGFAAPEGGLVMDGRSTISAELRSALGLPTSAKLVGGFYKGVFKPIPYLAEGRKRGGGVKEIEFSIKIKF